MLGALYSRQLLAGLFYLKQWQHVHILTLNGSAACGLGSVPGLGNARLSPQLLGFEISEYRFPSRGRGFAGLVSDIRHILL